eukprot:TRINITY_DN628_c1_g1_i3.p1 TRINITY_DN628_c1_g1~~TRINITY_DN628_c1_g1_i3.p1  ORF type:complete len:142 (+),score=79.34 TRINITY_DN628_c1_g1_i3:58-483(+)
MANFQNLAGIRTAIADVLRPNCYAGWVLLGYVNDNTIALQGSGEAGVDELATHLREDQVQYMLVRLSEQKGTTMSSRDIFIAWTGPRVSKIQAARKASNVGAVQGVLSPNHGQLTALNRDNFNEATVRARSAPGSGSHIID